MEIALAAPRRVYISAGVAALVAGIGLPMRFCCRWGGIRRRFSASVAHDPLAVGFREHGRSCRNRRASRSVCAPQRRPRSTARPPSRCAPLGGHILHATQAARRLRHNVLNRACRGQWTGSINRGRRPTANDVPPRSGPTKSALSCAASPTMDRPSCALPRSRSRSSDMRSRIRWRRRWRHPAGPFSISSVLHGVDPDH